MAKKNLMTTNEGEQLLPVTAADCVYVRGDEADKQLDTYLDEEFDGIDSMFKDTVLPGIKQNEDDIDALEAALGGCKLSFDKEAVPVPAFFAEYTDPETGDVVKKKLGSSELTKVVLPTELDRQNTFTKSQNYSWYYVGQQQVRTYKATVNLLDDLKAKNVTGYEYMNKDNFSLDVTARAGFIYNGPTNGLESYFDSTYVGWAKIIGYNYVPAEGSTKEAANLEIEYCQYDSRSAHNYYKNDIRITATVSCTVVGDYVAP